MIVIHASVLMDPQKREPAIAAATEMMAASRKEKGCVSYTFSSDLSEPGRFYIFEEWESDAALAAHFAMPHMARFQQAVAGFGIKEMKAERYEVTAKGPLRR